MVAKLFIYCHLLLLCSLARSLVVAPRSLLLNTCVNTKVIKNKEEWRKNRSSRRPPSVTSDTLETTESPPAIIEPQRTAEPVPSTQYPETPFGTRPTYFGVAILHNTRDPRESLWDECFFCTDYCCFCFPCWLYQVTQPPQSQPPPTAEIVPLPPNLAQIRY